MAHVTERGENPYAIGVGTDEIVAELGSFALSNGAPIGELTTMERLVLFQGSFGLIASDVAGVLQTTGEATAQTEDVDTARKALIVKFDVPNFAAAVCQAIELKYLPVDLTDEPEISSRITNRDRFVIDSFRKGKSTNQVKTALGKSIGQTKEVGKRLLAYTFTKTKADGRTHLVRRSYELGVEITHNVTLSS